MTGTLSPDARTALLACGLQNDFCANDGVLGRAGLDLSEIRRMVPAAQHVLAIARAAGLLVIHLPERALARGASESSAWRLQQALNGWPAGLGAEGGSGEEFVEGLGPRTGEPVVPRHRPGGLSDTRAPVLLRSAGVRRVILVGAETHRAVLATAIQAVCGDFEVIVPREAVAAADLTRSVAALDVLGSWARVVSVEDLQLEPTDLNSRFEPVVSRRRLDG